MLTLQIFPGVWKRALVIPLPKKGLSHNPVDYRPNSLLLCLSKVCEYVLAVRLDNFLASNDVLIPEQFSFRARHSTQHQLWRVTEIVHDAFDKGHVATAVFVDINKAFDKVSFPCLIYKLSDLNHPISFIKIIHSYISNCSFTVKVGSSVSSPRQITSGVPQGSILRSKLFNLYINDIPHSPDVHLALYANDTMFVTTDRIPTLAFAKLQAYL